MIHDLKKLAQGAKGTAENTYLHTYIPTHYIHTRNELHSKIPEWK